MRRSLASSGDDPPPAESAAACAGIHSAARPAGEAAETRVARTRVALLQSELEVAQTPSADLRACLDQHHALFRVESFTERTLPALLAQAHLFECLLIGPQALDQSPAIRKALPALQLTNLLVLHQHDSTAFAPLFGDPATTCVNLAGPLNVRVEGRVARAPHLEPIGDPLDIPILNWPHDVRVSVTLGQARSDGWRMPALLSIPEGDDWSPILVLPDNPDYAVVALEARRNDRRTLICTAELDLADSAHRSLLVNLAYFTGRGAPEVVLLSPREEARPPYAMLKLRALGWKVPRVDIDRYTREVFTSWPIRGASIIVLDDGLPLPAVTDDAAEAWLTGGRALVSVEPSGDIAWRTRAEDWERLAATWAFWFDRLSPCTWLGEMAGDKHVGGSLFKTRAILRCLAWLSDAKADTNARLVLAVPPPEDFRDAAGEILRKRQEPDGSFDGTVSTTVAALEIDQLTGGALAPSDRDRALQWLAAHIQRVPPAERLEAFSQCLHRHNSPVCGLDALDPLTMARALRAAVSGRSPLDAGTHLIRENDLDSSFPTACEFLFSTGEYLRHFHKLPGMLSYEDLDRAMACVDHNSAFRDLEEHPDAEHNPLLICAELLARAAVLRLGGSPIRPLGTASGIVGGLPALRQVLQELARVTESRVKAVTALTAEIRTRDSQLAVVRHMVGGSAVICAILSAVAVFLVFGLAPESLTLAVVALSVLSLAPAVIAPSWFPPWFLRHTDHLTMARAAVRNRLSGERSPVTEPTASEDH